MTKLTKDMIKEIRYDYHQGYAYAVDHNGKNIFQVATGRHGKVNPHKTDYDVGISSKLNRSMNYDSLDNALSVFLEKLDEPNNNQLPRCPSCGYSCDFPERPPYSVSCRYPIKEVTGQVKETVSRDQMVLSILSSLIIADTKKQMLMSAHICQAISAAEDLRKQLDKLDELEE